MIDLKETHSRLDTTGGILNKDKMQVNEVIVRSINNFLQPKVGRNKTQTGEATNQLLQHVSTQLHLTC